MRNLWDVFDPNCAGLFIYSKKCKNWGKGFVPPFEADKSDSD